MNTNDFVILGREAFDKHDFDAAEKYLKAALKSNAKYADIMNMLGVICQKNGDYDQAIDFFRRALKINANYTEAALNLVVLLNDLGRYKEAKGIYTGFPKAAAKKSGMIEPVLRGKLSNLHSDIGDIYRSIGMYHLAVEEYQKALSLNPNYHDIRTKLGKALRDAGQLKDSEKELQKVAIKKPGYIPARLQLGVTCFALGKITAARKHWSSVLKNDPENGYARMYLRLIKG